VPYNLASPNTLLEPIDPYNIERWIVRETVQRKPSRKGSGFKQPLEPHHHWHVDVSYINLSGTFHYLCSLDLDDPQLLEVGQLSATISVTVDLDYVADVSYEDENDGIWDPEEHTWVYRPTIHSEVEESANFDAELSLYFDPDDDKKFDVKCRIGKDFYVTVLPSEYD
jgi:hypothetical protein